MTDNLSKFQINVGKMLSVTTEVPSWNKRIDAIQVKIRQVINLMARLDKLEKLLEHIPLYLEASVKYVTSVEKRID